MNPLSSYPWHICGVGAIGGLWASALTHKNLSVTLLLKDALQLAQYQAADGIHVLQDETQTRVNPLALIPSSAGNEKIKHLLVCCKTYSTLEAIMPWRRHLTDDAQIVLLQNGMGSAQALQRALPRANIYCATSTDGAWRQGPFDLVRAGLGETLMGSFSDHLLATNAPDSVLSLLQLFDSAQASQIQTTAPQLNMAWHADIRTPMWHKLAINSVINALTAIYQCPNGELINHPQGRPRLQQLCVETQDVMARIGIVPLGQGLLKTALRILQQTALNKSSMLQDHQAGRPTEIDAINGYIIQQGALYHLPCAGHKQVCEDLRLTVVQEPKPQ